ncbi:MAG: hypothetical protein AAGF28_06530 [Pseudomonadota bacterium]
MTSAPNNTKKKYGTFGLRLKPEERAELERQAGTMPLGTYIKSQLLDSELGIQRRDVRRPVADQQALAQLLGLIGHSDVGARLNALSEAVENGSLVVDDEAQEAILSACAEIHAMHAMLLRALGFEVSL